MKINVEFDIEVVKDCDYYCCTVPNYGIVFSTKEFDKIEKIAGIMIKSYFNMLEEINNKKI